MVCGLSPTADRRRGLGVVSRSAVGDRGERNCERRDRGELDCGARDRGRPCSCCRSDRGGGLTVGRRLLQLRTRTRRSPLSANEDRELDSPEEIETDRPRAEPSVTSINRLENVTVHSQLVTEVTDHSLGAQ